MIDDKTETVLAEMFGRHSGWADGEARPGKMCPGFPDLVAFAATIAAEPGEEQVQRFLAERPQMLFGLFGEGGDSDQAFLTKPPIGTQYSADFGILNTSQGGCTITLVELEPSTEPLFTQQGTPARRLQGAIGQVQDWAQWIGPNRATFVRDTVALAMRMPPYPATAANKSFRLWEAEHIESSWRSFGGFDDPMISYAIIIGRWSRLSEEHRQRLVFLNRQDGRLATIYTFDQIARRAYDRPRTSSY